MESQMKMNLQFVDRLNEWNPFQLKKGGYDPEIADIIQAVYELNDPFQLAERIQAIYEFSFDNRIPTEKCLIVAKDLITIKENGSCAI